MVKFANWSSLKGEIAVQSERKKERKGSVGGRVEGSPREKGI